MATLRDFHQKSKTFEQLKLWSSACCRKKTATGVHLYAYTTIYGYSDYNNTETLSLVKISMLGQ